MKTPADKAKLDEIEELCLAEYRAHKYKIILAKLVNGWNAHDDSVEVFCDPPARLRVMRTQENDIRRWVDHEWCDPYWDVEPVEPHPALEGIRSLWVYGISHSVDGDIEGTSTQWLDPNQEPAYEPHEPRCPGCNHTKGEGCGCPPVTRSLTITCPCCGEEIAITITPAKKTK